MPIPKGSQLWMLRAKSGYDKKHDDPDELWRCACEYFQWANENPIVAEEVCGKGVVTVNRHRVYTMTGLQLYLNVNHSYFSECKERLHKHVELPEKKENARAMLDVIYQIENTVHSQKFEGAAAGIFNANLIIRDLGLAEKTDNKTDGRQVITVKYADGNSFAKPARGAEGGII